MSILRSPSNFRLFFPAQNRSFAKNHFMENKTDNDTLLRQYESFANMLIEDRIHMDGTLGFPEICSWIGADPEELDRLIQDELGLTGTGLLAAMREGERLNIRRKYDPHAQK